MNFTSRTEKGIRNTTYALFVYVVNIFLQFFSRRIFLQYLGTEVLGLNTTATSILQFLNLAELGIGTAVICTLYKPLKDRDDNTVREIVSVQAWLYKRVALFIIAASLLTMIFFPWIFEKAKLPLWYAYASFSVLLFSSLLSYFVNFREVVLSADQAEYKIQYSFKFVLLFKLIAQIYAVKTFENGYVWWLALEVFFAIVASFSLNHTILKSYPYLKALPECTASLRLKHNDVIVKIKQLFIHKLGAYAINQSTPLIIFALSNLTLVTIYGNYAIIFSGLSMLLFSLFNSLGAGVGNLIAEGNTEHTVSVFKELFSIRFISVSTFAVTVYFVTDSFITLWVGKEFVLDKISLIFLIVIFYFNQMRTITDIFLYGYSLFNDVWAAIVESLLNIAMAVTFGLFWGLPGILAGVLVSVFLVHFFWKPFFLYKEGFNKSVSGFYLYYLLNLIPFLIALFVTVFVVKTVSFSPGDSWLHCSEYIILIASCFGLTQCSLSILLIKPIKNFIKRLLCLKIK